MKQVNAGNTPASCALAVMTKAPRAGEVKTRLSPPLTPEEAAALNICFLRDISASIAVVAANNGARGVAVYTPADSEDAYAEILPKEFLRLPQRGDALGDRLALALEDIFRLGFTSGCLIGSDSPTIPRRAFVEAIRILAQPADRVVLGPSADGGYYLIGMKKLHRKLFQDIAWSSEHVVKQTVEHARRMNLTVHFLPAWYDVDDRANLRHLCDELFGSPERKEEGSPAPATREYLERLLKQEGRDLI
jgi:rSAM/selenodomain-associated transferase 1